jgi:hypothetical protein
MMEFNYRSVIDLFYCEYENKRGENCKYGRLQFIQYKQFYYFSVK